MKVFSQPPVCTCTNHSQTGGAVAGLTFYNLILKDNDYLSMSVPWRFSRFKPYSKAKIS